MTGQPRAIALASSAFVLFLLRVTSASAASTVTKGPWIQHVTSSSAIVRVEVQPPGPVSVEIDGGGAPDAGARRVVHSAEVSALHAIRVNDLHPATRYTYSVKAAGGSKPASFTTAIDDSSDVPFRFLVYGDNRTDDAAHAEIVRAMVPVASDFLIHTGDFVSNGAIPAQWQTFFEIEAPLLGSRCLFSCVGNHEIIENPGIEYARLFGPAAATRPEHLNGTFRWGNTRFFLLNGNVAFKGSVDRAWLDKSLDDADAEPGLKWRVAVVHHGPWSSGPHGGNPRLHEAGVPALLKKHRVDLVISGHDHIYERGWDDGTAFVVSGGGGAPIYKVKATIAQSKKMESARHFIEMSVQPNTMQLVATRPDGSVLDRCSLSKSPGKNAGGWDCDGPTAASVGSAAATVAAGLAAPSPSGASTPQTSRCGCRAVGEKALGTSDRARGGALVALGLCILRRRRSSSCLASGGRAPILR